MKTIKNIVVTIFCLLIWYANGAQINAGKTNNADIKHNYQSDGTYPVKTIPPTNGMKVKNVILMIADGIVERYDFDADKSHLKQI